MKMKKVALTVLAGMMAGSAYAGHFSYEGHGAPEFWGDLHRDFAACKTGKFQSPIDIVDAIESKQHRKISFYYTGNAESVINNGHTIQVSFKETSS